MAFGNFMINNNVISWHRSFGLTLMDLFKGSNFEVELEKELSIKKQYLDVVIIRRVDGVPIVELPVGLDNLVEHNLLTYKSSQEPLDDWAVEELIGHYVNYRKLVSSSLDDLLPLQQFQLYAVSTRYPQKLLSKEKDFKKLSEGVFDLKWGNRLIRLLVLNQIPLEQHNALWLLFNGKPQSFYYGNQHYKWHDPRQKAVLNKIFELYQMEGAIMPYTLEDFEKDYTREHLHLLSPQERLKGLPSEERLKGLSLEEVLSKYPQEVVDAYLLQLKKTLSKAN
jgi:hypothetical protein